MRTIQFEKEKYELVKEYVTHGVHDSTVCKCRKLGAAGDYVIKFYKKQYGPIYWDESEMIIHREQEALIALNKASAPVAEYIASGSGTDESDDPVHFVLTKHISDGDLFDLGVDRGPFTMKALRHIFKSIVIGLIKIHVSGFAHLDIKPENLILDAEGKVKIIDFGTAVSLKNGNIITPRVGTRSYAPPEVKSYTAVNAIGVDTFLAGVTLFILAYRFAPQQIELFEEWFEDEKYDSFWSIVESQDWKRTSGSSEKDYKTLQILLQGLLAYNPAKRTTLSASLASEWFLLDPEPSMKDIQAEICVKRLSFLKTS